MEKEQTEKKRIRPLRAIIIALAVIVLVLLIGVCAVIVSLAIRYVNYSYEYQPPVEREESFVMPDYPEVSLEPESSSEEGGIFSETSTDAPDSTETEEPTESEATDEPSENDPETSEDDTDYLIEIIPPSISTEPETTPPSSETLPPVINPTETSQSQSVPPSNPNASFANSPNAISVYANVPIYKVKQKDPNILNILVLGTDSRDVTRDRGRSDTMIVVSYNKQTGNIKLTSLLRDSLVPISGHEWDRLNTAYFYGGVGLAINTINELYNLDIQEFLVFDLNGAKDLLKHIGGANITLTKEEVEFYNYHMGTKFTVGVNHLEPDFLLMHMRNRTLGTDFERSRRQRDAIVEIFKQIASEKSISEIYALIDYMFGLVKTNISLSSLTSMATSMIGNLSRLNIESQNVPYSDSFYYAWYKGMSIITYDIADAGKRLNKFIYN